MAWDEALLAVLSGEVGQVVEVGRPRMKGEVAEVGESGEVRLFGCEYVGDCWTDVEVLGRNRDDGFSLSASVVGGCRCNGGDVILASLSLSTNDDAGLASMSTDDSLLDADP